MNIILDFTIFIGKSLYTTLPAILANMAPLFVKNMPILVHPLDFGLTIKGSPILGSKKTLRGLFSGIILSMLTFYVQYLIYRYTSLKNLSLIDYNTVNIHLLGFLMGFGVMFGDIFESFIKRRLNMPVSKSLVPWDQLDCVLGGLVFVRIGWNYSLKYAITIIVLTFFVHIIGRHIGYYIGLCKSKW